MAQAKTLSQAEIDQVLRYTSKSRYAARNRCLILTSFWSGMRVAEIANLKMRDVLNEDHTIKTEIRLSAAQTKGNESRVVFIPQKLRDEFASYLKTRKIFNPEIPFFHSSNRLGFNRQIHYVSGSFGLISALDLIMPLAIQAAGRSLPH
jgi:integrase/recombinase XerD